LNRQRLLEETMLRTARRFVPVVSVLVLAAPLTAFAQRDARVTASLSSACGDGGPAPTVALAAAFPVVSRIRAEIEGTFVRSLDFGQYYSCPPQAICAAVVSFPFTLNGR